MRIGVRVCVRARVRVRVNVRGVGEVCVELGALVLPYQQVWLVRDWVRYWVRVRAAARKWASVRVRLELGALVLPYRQAWLGLGLGTRLG